MPASPGVEQMEFLTVPEAARRCAVSSRYLWTCIARGEIRPVRFGARATRIERRELERWIAAARSRSQ